MAMVDSNNSAETEATASDTPPTPGSQLRQARERAGLSVAQAAQQLHLLPAQVVALEEDRYEGFSGDLFVKGHLRSYARLLKLDVIAVIGERRVSQRSPAVERRRSLPRLSLETAKRQRRHWGLGAALLVILSLWGWQQARDHSELLPLTAIGDTGEVVPLGGIGNAISGDDNSALLDSVQLLPNPKPTADAPAAPAAAGTAAADSAQAAVASGDQLSLRFSADCWVEIKDRDNKLLVAALKHADEELKIEGRGPFKVLLGYAPGVEMAYNGTPVKVDTSDRSHSARMIVGNS